MASSPRAVSPSPTTATTATGTTHVATSPGSVTASPAGGLHLSTRPPPLEFRFHWLRPSLYFLFLLFCNVLIPCLLYYLLQIYTPLDEQTLVGVSSAALGLSSCFDAPFRLFLLVKHHKKFGPLSSTKWWHLDSFMFAYTICLFVFAFPLAIAPAIPLYDFFLMSPALLIMPMGVILLLSLHSWQRLPFPISSTPPRSPTRPGIYYIAEDLAAVDFGFGRTYRRQLDARYRASPPFRAHIMHLTVFWVIGAFVHFGVTAGLVWGTKFGVAFGASLGWVFVWMIIWGVASYLITKLELAHEYRWWAECANHDKEYGVPTGGVKSENAAEGTRGRSDREEKDEGKEGGVGARIEERMSGGTVGTVREDEMREGPKVVV
ncbi:hypothetical protein MNV49_001748 [Pseudohyphozyma bogoriensis]|nr:hypothetical protein MNV49_001748 [Pseudohyphozyma bogoriensis]